MAIISNINDKLTVSDQGQVSFNRIGTSTTTGYTFPALDGTANQILKTNGDGILTFVNDENDDAVTKIIGGTNITVSPASGLGDVTINADLVGTVTGSGTINKVSRWTATGSNLGDGPITFSSDDSTFAGEVAIRSDQGANNNAVLRLRGQNTTNRITRLQFEDYKGTLADGLIQFRIPTADTALSALLEIGINSAGLTLNHSNNATFTGTITSGALTVGNSGTSRFTDTSAFPLQLNRGLDVDVFGQNGPVLSLGSLKGSTYVDAARITAGLFTSGTDGDFGIQTLGGGTYTTALSINNSQNATFTGLVSGITPTAAANFATKAYVDSGDGSSINTILVTAVAVAGQGNRYFLDGVQQANAVLQPGFTYRFDQSATTPSPGNGPHPLRFSITPDGTHNSGVEYTTGVTVVGTPGTAGAYTQIITTQATPVTLYYYCIYHSGMGSAATIRIIQTDGTGYFADGLNVGKATVAAANAAADNIVIKGEGNAVGLTISNSVNSGTGTIFFGDVASSAAAGFRYNHNTGDMAVSAEDNINFACDRIGIGTTTPLDKLTISGGTGDSSSNDAITTLTRISSTGNVLAGKIVLTAPSTYQQNMVFRIKSTASSGENPSYYTDAMTVRFDGNVGIGTASPVAPLQIERASNTTLALSNSGSVTSGTRGEIAVYNSSISTVAAIKAVVDTSATADNVGTDLTFFTRAIGGSLTQKMVIKGGGNVGIGTNSPVMGLHVADTKGALFGLSGSGGASAYFSPSDENTLNGGYGIDSDTGDLWLNYRGYQDGFTRFRDTRIGNGKGGLVALFDGSNGNAIFTGNVIMGGTAVDQAGSFSAKSDGFIRGVLASGSNESSIINAISGVSNGFQLLNTASNEQSYIFHSAHSGGPGVSFKIEKDGTCTAAGDLVAYSDKRLKSNIKTLDGSKVYDMRGVSFIKDNKKGSGVIAQEMQKIAPELVNEGSEYLGVAYGNLTGYLIEAIKELKAEIEELKKCKCDCKK